jgi:nucleoside-diphosphate-sugar epimerase
MRSLVAGGSGFIGSHLVERLLARGDSVVVLDNFLTGRRENLAGLTGNGRLRVIVHDLTKPLPAESLLERFDCIFHLASPASPVGYRMFPIETHLVNSVGTFSLLEIARRVGARFVLASTSEVYGEPLVHPQSEDYWGNVNPIGPRSCYDESKRFAESLTIEFYRHYGLDARIARIFNTYGPRSRPDDGRVVPNFCVQALRGKPMTIYGDGSQTRSFCYVDDLVAGLLALGERDGLAGEVVNLGNPVEITIRQLAETIAMLAGSRSPIHYQGLPADDPTRRCPDIRKAQRILGWTPRVSLEDGLQRTLDWFRACLNAHEGEPDLLSVPELAGD